MKNIRFYLIIIMLFSFNLEATRFLFSVEDYDAVVEVYRYKTEEFKVIDKIVLDNYKIIKLDLSDELAGNDLDNNKIRDDIDQYISNLKLNNYQINFIKFYAKYLQEIAIKTEDSIINPLKFENEFESNGLSCALQYFKDKESKYIVDLIKYTFNTELRNSAYFEYFISLNRQVIVVDPNQQCNELFNK